MTIGIRTFREPKMASWISGMLVMPFIGKLSDYTINRRQWDDGRGNENEK